MNKIIKEKRFKQQKKKNIQQEVAQNILELTMSRKV